MPFDTAAITKIPPKRLLLIVGGGIGAGLLWRRFKGKSSVQVAGTDPGVDTSLLALGQNSAGNLAYTGGGGGGGLAVAATEPVASPNDATRDMGQGYFPLPQTIGIVTNPDGSTYVVDVNGDRVQFQAPQAPGPEPTITGALRP